MTGLFFAVDPVWWIGTFHTSSILIALTLGVLLGLFFFAYHHFQNHPQSTYHLPPATYNPIDTAHPDYAGLTLIEIRRYLTDTYLPRHSWAHTPSQIATYATDQGLIDIIRQLEQAEYAKKELTREEKEEINKELGIKTKSQDKKIQKQ